MTQLVKAGLLIVPLALYLTGCVVVATDDASEHMNWKSSETSWVKEQKENKKSIAKLNLGDSYEQVKADMGVPAFNEAFQSDGKQVNVLFYRTQHKRSDGETTKDECTPLIFVDGELTSWGQKAYEKL